LFEYDDCITGLELNDSVRYGIIGNATDQAGLTSENIASNNSLTVDISPIPQTCDDGVQNGGESDIDCGEVCPDKCGGGERCEDDNDCFSDNCGDNDRCIQATCDDDIKNDDESDVDCGGNDCDECEIGEKCDRNSDCESGNCDASSGRCEAEENKCTDGRLEPDNSPHYETDVDCGGDCAPLYKCDIGQQCDINGDCRSSVCLNSLCQAPTCTDGARNGQETDIDCGGNACGPCGAGKQCISSNDCESGQCDNGICQVPTDSDNDGMDDDWEEQYGLDPTDPSDANDDNDNDGLTNFEEFKFGTNPTLADTDGDGASDKREVDAGTNPNDPNDKPGSILLWILIIIIIIIVLALGGFMGYKKWQESQLKPKPLAPQRRQMPTQMPRRRLHRLMRPILRMRPQLALKQSLSSSHLSPPPHLSGQTSPQSISDSPPFWTPSSHVCGISDISTVKLLLDAIFSDVNPA